MSYLYQPQQRRRRQKEWYEVVWDAIKGVAIQILFALIDGVVIRIKQEVLKAFGYQHEDDWRTQYR